MGPETNSPGRGGCDDLSRDVVAAWAVRATSRPGAGSASRTEPENTDQETTALPPVTVTAPFPLIGSGLDPNTLPAETHVLNSGDLVREGTPSLQRALDQQVPGVALGAASGNPFQPTFFYHGFAASPLQGTPQGLAVYVNGMRFNQPFGDTVDWDLIPDIAIDRINLEGSNPVFGLNALGGSVNVLMKNGFTYHGLEADLSGGSFGQVQGEFQYGKQIGDSSVYVAGNVLHQGGWRDLQSTDLQNFYGDAGWRGDRAEVHLNLTLAHSLLNGPGTSPVELLAADPAAQFTAPNQITNQYAAVSLSGSFEVNANTSVQALAYYRYFLQRVFNGNAPNDTPCDDGSGLLCSSPGMPNTTLGGGAIPDFLNGGPYSELDLQTTNTNAYGASVQMTNTADVFGLKNNLIVGTSFDGAQTEFGGVGLIGGITPIDRVFIGPGVVLDEPGTDLPVRVAIGERDVWALSCRHAEPDVSAVAHGIRPAECGADRSYGPERRRPLGPPQLHPYQSGGRGHISVGAVAGRLCRLRRREPRADTAGTFLCRSGKFVQPGEFFRRRPGAQTGGGPYVGGRVARLLRPVCRREPQL